MNQKGIILNRLGSDPVLSIHDLSGYGSIKTLFNRDPIKYGEEYQRYLRSIDGRALLEIYKKLSKDTYDRLPLLTRDGMVTHINGVSAGLASSQQKNNIPVIAGSNKDELSLWLGSNRYFVKASYPLTKLVHLPKLEFKKDNLNSDEFTEIDKWVIKKANDLQNEIRLDFENYEIHLAFQKILSFCSNEVGSFYLDIVKDRLYTSKKDGAARKSSQLAIFHVLNGLIRWVAPILSYTAEEAYQEFNKDESSVFLLEWYENWPEFDCSINDETWELLLLMKTEVNKYLEEKRNNRDIG